ncbi:TRAP transporter substrate-binding protein [Paracidovorax citrulli]|uniref:TRAP dicarboxylate transporter, DctP subunit n=2 Tax=Paracidovorax citrulli TaxID=80869 RepID=A1TQC6_PARC0|nr:TRAP transporter substrate-binding protein [Paracidovorax citrulli]ABM33164.1 TRAP dicarboxylate transporter, DctP subunit [Paracidovorax citrulli AAC00-1]ATG92896.1 C4-dicarboxylate ABC transporter [Paracidovorax citrulli]PVY67394.1 tripartite ATP-independent transporter DctP family solute receptor [Paracidovorax citrulli]REG68447.1 tripartite ATP-independent transporter DctP family solute receptor [Paracidovorax citrulli]RLJ93004.1 tripartite ATP-independent transporter DctP family solute
MKFIKTTLAAVAACLTAFAAQATEFRSADIHPDDYPTVTAVKFMGERLKALSGGKHSIKVYSSGALGNEKDAIEQAKIGALQMVRINIGAMNNICPETVVPTMPFLFRSVEHLHKVLDGPVGEEILKACERQGFVGLAYYDSGARSMFTAKKPVRKFEDMKGMKVRVQQSDLWVSMLEAMGANATPMPMGEVYTGLKTGLIDAAENNYPTYESSRSFEVAKYYTRTEHSMAPEMLLFSKRAWDRLSPQEQGWIRQAAKESVPYMRKQWAEREVKSLATVKAGGAEIIEIDKAPFQAAMKPVYEKFITDAKLKDLVKRVQDTQ